MCGFAGDGGDIVQFACLHLVHQVDDAERVFVHREIVIAVELHERDDAPEIGNEAAQHAGLVHAAEDEGGIFAGDEDFEEQLVGKRVLAHRIVDIFEVAGDVLQREGMDVLSRVLRDAEKTQHIERMGFQTLFRAEGQAVIEDFEAEIAFSLCRGGIFLVLDCGQENARQIPHVAGDEEVMLHKAFDGFAGVAAGVAEAFGEVRLDIEMQAFFGAARDLVQVAADGEEEIVAFGEAAGLRRGEDVDADEVVQRPCAVKDFGDPEKRLEIAQAAFAFLDVGFQNIAGVAVAGVAFVAFGQFALHEDFLFGWREKQRDFITQTFAFRDVSGDGASVDQRGEDFAVFLREVETFGAGAYRMADLQSLIPQGVEEFFDFVR